MKKYTLIAGLILISFLLYQGYALKSGSVLESDNQLKQNKNTALLDDEDLNIGNEEKTNMEDVVTVSRMNLEKMIEKEESSFQLNYDRSGIEEKLDYQEQDAVGPVEVLELGKKLSDRNNNIKKEDNKSKNIRKKIEDTEETTKQPERVSLMDKVQEYRVAKGDNLWKIASKFNIDIDTIIGANDITNMNRIRIGDKLQILPVKGILYKVNPGESLSTISNNFDISIDSIVQANAITDPNLVDPRTTLLIPGAKPEFGYQERMSRRFMKPVHGRISSPFGMRWGKMHEGIDIAVNTGTIIRASRSGKVVFSGWSGGYGYAVIIEHQKGVRTLYAHNSKLLVSSGEHVERGQSITKSGNTGRSTGPHLHFEIQINGRAVNPLNYLDW